MILSALALAPTATITLIDGRAIKLSGRPATAVVFLTHECPIANDSQPDLERVHQKFKSKGVAIIGVYIDPTTSIKTIQTHKREFKFTYPQSHDRTHTLVKQFKATHTPEAILLDEQGQVQYRGLINNMYSDLGVRRKSVTKQYLSDAITSVLAGKPVATPKTKPYGCLIPDLADYSGL
jgi:peroxiredoxin